jgi:hypothetical protein
MNSGARSVLVRLRLSSAPMVLGVAFASWVTGCAGVDPEANGADLIEEMDGVGLGTESGNPTEPSGELEQGTESGNPSLDQPTPAEQTGTESGNPTHPPPAPVSAMEPVPEAGPTEPMQVPEPVVPPSGAAGAPGIGTPDVGVAPEPFVPTPTQPAGVAGSPAMPPGSEQPAPTATAGEPCEPTACAAEAEAVAQSYAQPLPASEPFTAGSCSETSDCTCSASDGGFAIVDAELEGCLVAGRLGCLYSSEEYEPCRVDEPSDCEATCRDVQSARALDAEGFEVTVRASGCAAAGCRYVLQAGDACFVGGSDIAPVEADCGLDDAALLDSR